VLAGGGTARPGGPSAPAGLDALRRLVDAGAKPRTAAGIVAELTGGSANELYRALMDQG
jgi:16S rRNA (cytidine1402-2'-O)-methyltransferase